MKFFIRLVIFVILLSSNFGLLSESYAISSNKVEHHMHKVLKHMDPQRPNPNQEKRRKKRLQRGSFYNISGPKKLIISGLFCIGFGAMLLLDAARGKSKTIGETFENFILSFIGTILLAAGSLVFIIGGVWWLFRTFGN